ncbi:MAG: response regulator, partial [Methylomarinum sp.]|nr:response regulator [Methylomarinum sp.]
SYGNDAKESVIKITNPQTVFLTERLEDAITQHYLLEHKKSQAVQNIFFLISVFGIGYISFLLFNLSRQSKQLNNALFDIKNQQFALNQHAIVSTTNVHGEITYINEKFANISGFTKKELIGHTHSMVNSGHHDITFFKTMWQTIAQGQVWHGEIKNKTKQGEFYWVHATIVPFFNNKGKPTQYIAIRTDITFQKRLEEQLLENQNVMDKLTSTMAQGVYAMDTNGLCTFWNKEAERILGWRNDDLMGKGIHNIIHFQDAEGNPVPKEHCPTQKSILKNETFSSESDVFTHKDGNMIPISIKAVPLIDKGIIIGSVAVFSDNSEHLFNQQRLMDAIEEAELANKAKSDFLANMSHEIRTPMNGIIGMTELALDTELNQEQKEYLNIVKDSSHALLTIINDILDFSKIEAGKLELEFIEFNLHDLLKETTRTLSIRAYQKGLEMILDISPVVPSILYGDPGRIRQILINLLGNAIKFTESGEIKLSVLLSIGGGDKSCLQFDVSDTGIGISEQRQETIFEAFTQEDSSVSRKYGGTGLGLSISAQLIHLMNGEIWLESIPNKGTTFSFTVWFKHQVNTEQDNAIASLQNIPVLIVDDNDSNRQIMGDLFTQWGMLTTTVATSQAALKELSQPTQHFKLLLIDSILSDMTGFDLVKQIQNHQLYNEAIIMLLSSGMDAAEIDMCKSMGLSGYIVKPMSHSDILDELHSVFDISVIAHHIQPETSEQTLTQALTILVAEDNPINQKLAYALLTKHGHQVVIANNGLEAVKEFQKHSFDLILMDFQMPELDGLEATQQIRSLEQKSHQHIPIIAMTANALKEDRERALSAGMDDYISKPINSALLFNTIGKYFKHQPQKTSQEKPGSSLQTCHWEAALSRLEGDTEILELLSSMFITEQKGYLEKINTAFNTQDWVLLKRELHTLKGVCSTLGADKAEDLLKQAEVLTQQEQSIEIKPLIIELEQEIKTLTEILKTRLPKAT